MGATKQAYLMAKFRIPNTDTTLVVNTIKVYNSSPKLYYIFLLE